MYLGRISVTILANVELITASSLPSAVNESIGTADSVRARPIPISILAIIKYPIISQTTLACNAKKS